VGGNGELLREGLRAEGGGGGHRRDVASGNEEAAIDR
jgi:hypothetical protein